MADRMSQNPKLASLYPVTPLHNSALPSVAGVICATPACLLRRTCAWNKSIGLTPGAVLFTSSFPDRQAAQKLDNQSFRGRPSDSVQCRRLNCLRCMFHARAGCARQWFGACTVASPSDATERRPAGVRRPSGGLCLAARDIGYQRDEAAANLRPADVTTGRVRGHRDLFATARSLGWSSRMGKFAASERSV